MTFQKRNFPPKPHLRLADIPATHDFQQTQNSARDGDTSGRPSPTKGDPVDANDNVTEIGEARRIDPTPLTDSLAAIERMRLEMGTTPAELIAGEVEDARVDLMSALKLADKYGEREIHMEVGQIVLAVDDLREKLAKRGRGS